MTFSMSETLKIDMQEEVGLHISNKCQLSIIKCLMLILGIHSGSQLEKSYESTVNPAVLCLKRIFIVPKKYANNQNRPTSRFAVT